jgi:hypothetical protein
MQIKIHRNQQSGFTVGTTRVFTLNLHKALKWREILWKTLTEFFKERKRRKKRGGIIGGYEDG